MFEDDTSFLNGCLAWIVGIVVVGLIGFFALSAWIGPQYNVWNAAMTGQAELAQANYNRQTKVVEARANLEAQDYNAQSEVVRAKGVAQANNIIKDSITPEYIRYLWVQTLDKTSHDTIIYVPTEANLPLSEASRAIK